MRTKKPTQDELTIDLIHKNNKNYYKIRIQGKTRYYNQETNKNYLALQSYIHDKYIKNKPKGTLKQYQNAYQEALTTTKIKYASKAHRQAATRIKNLKKGKTISQYLKKGKAHITIDALNTTQQDIQQAKKELLKQLITDQGIIDIMQQDDNFNKLTPRLQYNATIRDNNQNIIAKNITTLNKPIQRVIRELQEHLIEGQYLDKNNYNIFKDLNETGWNADKNNITKQGTITSITLTINLIKA